MDGKVCPLASPSQSVGDIQYPFLLPPAIKLTRHFFDWGRQHIQDHQRREITHSFRASWSSLLLSRTDFTLGP